MLRFSRFCPLYKIRCLGICLGCYKEKIKPEGAGGSGHALKPPPFLSCLYGNLIYVKYINVQRIIYIYWVVCKTLIITREECAATL